MRTLEPLINPTQRFGQTSPADWLATVPVPIFGASLGLLGLSLIAAMNPFLAAIPLLKGGSMVLGTIALAAAVALHLMRLAIRRDAFMRDLRNAAIAPFFGQTGIALLLLAEAARPVDARIAVMSFVAGSVVSALLALHGFIIGLRARVALAVVTPGWLVAPIGMLYIGLLAPAFGMAAMAPMVLFVGSLMALSSGALLCARMIAGPALPLPAKPALAIAVAIPALMLLALLESPSLKQTVLAPTLFGATLCAYMAALAALPAVARRPFATSWWAFGMPLVAAAIAFDAYAREHAWSALAVLANGSALLSVAMVASLCIASFAGMRRHVAPR
jgi:tellurite resistance protein